MVYVSMHFSALPVANQHFSNKVPIFVEMGNLK